METLQEVTRRLLDRLSAVVEPTENRPDSGPGKKRLCLVEPIINDKLLRLIENEQGLTYRIIAEKLRLNRDSISSHLSKLVKLGKIKRIKGPKGFSYFKG